MSQYKYLIWSGTATLTILSLFLLVAMNRISDTAAKTNTISFSGEGKIFAVPDIAAVSFSIITESPTSKVAQDQNSEKSEKIVKFLKNQNIEDKDIKTTSYSIYPQYSYPKPLPLGIESATYPEYYPSNPKITGYQVNQSFELKIRNLEKVSAMLDGLVTAGANNIQNLGFQVDNEDKLKEQARELAIKDAKEKAGALKKQLGIRLGKIVNYNEGGYYPVYFKAEALDNRDGVGSGGPSVPTGENEIVVQVTITYQIK